MGEISKDALEKIKAQLISDYYTPTYRFEVAFDTLITPYIDEIVNNCTYKDGNKVQLYTEFVAKEMSVQDDRMDNRGNKIDYILADNGFVYLVELKTTDGSISTDQAKYYLDYCYNTPNGEYKKFADVLSDKLISILGTAFDITKPQVSNMYENILIEIFIKIIEKHFALFNYVDKDGDSYKNFTDIAKELIKNNKWANKSRYSSRKYLYTLAQLLDYLKPLNEKRDYTLNEIKEHLKSQEPLKNELWRKQMKLIYITPDGTPPELFKDNNYADFYAGTISIKNGVQKYLEKRESDGLAKILTSAIKEIYGEPKCKTQQ